jgi:lactoylglutathione lyase
MYTQLFPILTTPDLDRALGFYRDLLGATVTFEFPGPDGESGYVGLELGSRTSALVATPPWNCRPAAG